MDQNSTIPIQREKRLPNDFPSELSIAPSLTQSAAFVEAPRDSPKFCNSNLEETTARLTATEQLSAFQDKGPIFVNDGGPSSFICFPAQDNVPCRPIASPMLPRSESVSSCNISTLQPTPEDPDGADKEPDLSLKLENLPPEIRQKIFLEVVLASLPRVRKDYDTPDVRSVPSISGPPFRAEVSPDATDRLYHLGRWGRERNATNLLLGVPHTSSFDRQNDLKLPFALCEWHSNLLELQKESAESILRTVQPGQNNATIAATISAFQIAKWKMESAETLGPHNFMDNVWRRWKPEEIGQLDNDMCLVRAFTRLARVSHTFHEDLMVILRMMEREQGRLRRIHIPAAMISRVESTKGLLGVIAAQKQAGMLHTYVPIPKSTIDEVESLQREMVRHEWDLRVFRAQYRALLELKGFKRVMEAWSLRWMAVRKRNAKGAEGTSDLQRLSEILQSVWRFW